MHPQPGKRVLDREQRRLRDGGLIQLIGVRATSRGIEETYEIHSTSKYFGTPVELVAEDGLGLVEVLTHADVLGALTGEQERDRVRLRFLG